MSCARHFNAIVDHACGADISSEAAGHLAACEACCAWFEEQRRMLEGLDDELQRALAVVPSATFARRVHSRIEQAPARFARALWWSACGAAAAILLVIGINLWRSGGDVRRFFQAPSFSSRQRLRKVGRPFPSVRLRWRDGKTLDVRIGRSRMTSGADRLANVRTRHCRQQKFWFPPINSVRLRV